MRIILFYYILTLLIGIIIIYLNMPEPIILIKKQKNMMDDNGVCLLQDNKCINL
jgi:hypothetical protein